MNNSLKAFEAKISETDDGKWDGTLRAFWRRLQGYGKCKYNDVKELPEKMPVEFRAYFATALLASPLKPWFEKIELLDNLNEEQALIIDNLRAEIRNLQGANQKFIINYEQLLIENEQLKYGKKNI